MTQKGLIVVTGGSSGIGNAIVKQFATAGYSVLSLDRSGGTEELQRLPNVLCEKADVTNLEQMQCAVEKGVAKFGEVECFVNNAGMMLLGTISAQNPEEWMKMLNVNVMGVLNGIKTVVGKMMERRSGTVINISSIAGFKTFPNHAAYCATKYAVHGLTENLRQEVSAHDVRSITISPGVVETALLSHTSSSEIKSNYTQWKKDIEGGLEPDDIARAVKFAFEQPQRVCIREIVIAPTRQEA